MNIFLFSIWLSWPHCIELHFEITVCPNYYLLCAIAESLRMEVSGAVDQCPCLSSHWPGYCSVICGCLVSPWPLSQMAWLTQPLFRCHLENSLRCFPRQNLSVQVLCMTDVNITHSQVLSYSDERALSSAYPRTGPHPQDVWWYMLGGLDSLLFFDSFLNWLNFKDWFTLISSLSASPQLDSLKNKPPA